MQINFLLQRSRVAAVRALALTLVWVEFVGSLLDIEDQNFSLFVMSWIDLLSSQTVLGKIQWGLNEGFIATIILIVWRDIPTDHLRKNIQEPPRLFFCQ